MKPLVGLLMVGVALMVACGRSERGDGAEGRGAEADAGRPSVAAAVAGIVVAPDQIGWGGLRVGMTAAEVEAVVAAPLPLSGTQPDELCGYHAVEVNVEGQTLGLEFDGDSAGAPLLAVELVLATPAEPLEVPAAVERLKDRFADLRWVPSRHDPSASEAATEKPLYALPSGYHIFIDPERGVYLGRVCVD